MLETTTIELFGSWRIAPRPDWGAYVASRPHDNQSTMVRPHYTDTATAPLVTSTTTCQLQDRCSGFPVLDWWGTWLPGGGLSARRRRQRLPTFISRHNESTTCITRHTFNIFGDRCFAADGPRLWNSLPIYLGQCHSLEQFKHLLKVVRTCAD